MTATQDPPRVIDAFGTHDFLSQLGERHRMRLATGVRPFTAKDGDVLAHEGQTASAFYLVQEGRVAIGQRDDRAFKTIDVAGPGEVVGWSWLLPPHQWQFECRALGPVRGLAFDAEWLREQCEQDPELGYHLLKHLFKVVVQRLAASRRAARKAPLTNF